MDLAGLTQADLARAAGCHPRSVRYWENKGRNPPTNVASITASLGSENHRGHSTEPQNGNAVKKDAHALPRLAVAFSL